MTDRAKFLPIFRQKVGGFAKVEFSVASLLPVGASTSFTVTFAPAAPGDSLGALRIFTDDPEMTPFEITLTGKCITPADAWRQSHFGSSENSGDAADDADPDHDGLSNLMEFALNAYPQAAGAGESPVIVT